MSPWFCLIGPAAARQDSTPSAATRKAGPCSSFSRSGMWGEAGSFARFQPGTCTARRSNIMKREKQLKAFPTFQTDEEAARFVDEADLSDYDLSGFKPMQFEFQPKTERVNMRLPSRLLAAVKTSAAKAGVPYQR